MTELELLQRPSGPEAENIYCLALHGKSVLMPVQEPQ